MEKPMAKVSSWPAFIVKYQALTQGQWKWSGCSGFGWTSFSQDKK